MPFKVIVGGQECNEPSIWKHAWYMVLYEFSTIVVVEDVILPLGQTMVDPLFVVTEQLLADAPLLHSLCTVCVWAEQLINDSAKTLWFIKLNRTIQNKLLQDIETETETFRSEQSMFYKSKADGISSDMDAIEKENKKVIQRY